MGGLVRIRVAVGCRSLDFILGELNDCARVRFVEEIGEREQGNPYSPVHL